MNAQARYLRREASRKRLHDAKRRTRGFTLVEMLISIAVLSILVLLLCTIMITTSSTVGSSWSRLESDEDGRLVLDRLQLDLQNMLIRSDIDYDFYKNQNSLNDAMAFYATAGGYTTPSGTTKRVVSVISYVMGTSTSGTGQPILERGSNDSFQWGVGNSQMYYSTNPVFQTSSSTTFSSTTNIRTLDDLGPTPVSGTLDVVSNDIFRFEISYVFQNPTPQTNPTPPALVGSITQGTQVSISNIAAIVVTVAEMDSQNSKIVPNTSWAKLVKALPDATGSVSGTSSAYTVSAGTSTAQAWNAAITGPTFAATAGIPQKAAAAIRVYERYFYLTTPPSQANL